MNVVNKCTDSHCWMRFKSLSDEVYFELDLNEI